LFTLRFGTSRRRGMGFSQGPDTRAGGIEWEA
jgi:hypothetical protein